MEDTISVLYRGRCFILHQLKNHDTFVLTDGAIEASPAVYNDYVVVGTRDCKI